MFDSFFPRPKLFFSSAFLWFLALLGIWHLGVSDIHQSLDFLAQPELAEGERAPFLTSEKLWAYIFIVATTMLFCVIWFFIEPHRWFRWSVFCSACILLFTYFSVQVSVWVNSWFGTFFDLIQLALSEPGAVSLDEYYGELKTVIYVLFPNIVFIVITRFINAHYTFRWRTAMNEYYMSHWGKLRHIEGASQRIQEDTQRFADIVENLGSAFVSSIMTLLAFLPILWTLSAQVTELPFIGDINGGLIFVALMSAIFGTVVLALVGIRLPGLQFKNQKVEAAYRKELVFGEEDPDRAAPPTIAELYGNVRKNYYRIFAEYSYFNFFRFGYAQGSILITYIVLGPTIVASAITLGVYQQISNAFSQVENSFQYLVNSWTTIVELLSIRKRLKLFEEAIDGSVDIDQSEYGLKA